MFTILVLLEVLKLLLHNYLLTKNTALKKDIMSTTLTSWRSQFSYFESEGYSRFGSCLFIISMTCFYYARILLSHSFVVRSEQVYIRKLRNGGTDE